MAHTKKIRCPTKLRRLETLKCPQGEREEHLNEQSTKDSNIKRAERSRGQRSKQCMIDMK